MDEQLTDLDREKLWRLVTDAGREAQILEDEIHELQAQLHVDEELRLERVNQRLRRLGFDNANLRPLTRPSFYHLSAKPGEIEPLIVRAKGRETTALDRLYREHLANKKADEIERARRRLSALSRANQHGKPTQHT